MSQERPTDKMSEAQQSTATDSWKPIPSTYQLVWTFFDEEDGGGLVLRRCEDERKLNWHSLPTSEGFDSFNVVGEKYRLDQIQSASFSPGAPVRLIPEPDNPHDPNAVAVWNEDRTRMAGYVPREDAVRIGEKWRTGRYRAIVMWETWKNNGRVGIRLLLIRDDARLLN